MTAHDHAEWIHRGLESSRHVVVPPAKDSDLLPLPKALPKRFCVSGGQELVGYQQRDDPARAHHAQRAIEECDREVGLVTKTSTAGRRPAGKTVGEGIPLFAGEGFRANPGWIADHHGKAALQHHVGKVNGGRKPAQLPGFQLPQRLLDLVFAAEPTQLVSELGARNRCGAPQQRWLRAQSVVLIQPSPDVHQLQLQELPQEPCLLRPQLLEGAAVSLPTQREDGLAAPADSPTLRRHIGGALRGFRVKRVEERIAVAHGPVQIG